MANSDDLSTMSYDNLIKRLQGGAQTNSQVYNETNAELRRRDYYQNEKNIDTNKRLTTINKWQAIAMAVLTFVLIIVTAYDVFYK